MVQSISTASAAATQIGSSSAAKTTGTDFDSILSGVSTTTSSSSETSSTQDSSKTSDSKSTSKSDKASSAQTTTCGKCGAVYQGDNPPAICTKCGNDLSAQSSGSSQDPNSLLDTDGTSKATGATDSTSAVSAVSETSETTGNNTAPFDFSTQIPATINI